MEFLNHTRHLRLRLILLSVGLPGLIACSQPADFKGIPSDLGSIFDVNESLPTDEVVCDPFGEAVTGSNRDGLRGSIYELPDGLPQATSSFDMIRRGRRLPADLYLSRVHVPTRAFNAGFAAPGREPLQNEKGEVLFEWFGMKLDTQIKLTDADEPGEYQFAVISDDGSTLAIADHEGIFRNVVENDGDHSTKMGCATSTVRFENSDVRKPMRLTYYQGPRDYIAAVVMWRRVSDATNLKDVECGKSGNSYFFEYDRNAKVSREQTPYKNLLARGWKPLAAGNYELRDNHVNQCR